MGGLLNFVGGVAGAAADTASTRMKNAEDEATQVRRDERQNDLALKRERSVAELRQEFARADDDRKREQSAADGQAINSGAGEVNRARMAGLINSRNGSSMTADDAKVLENNPEAIKAYGMEPRSRSQEYDDKINVAEGRGLMGQAKELRGQQDIEIRRGSEERRLVADENRSKALAAETARKEKHDEDWRVAQEATNATNQKRVEAILSGKPQKTLAGSVFKQLTEVRDTAATIGNLSATFKDDFAGKGVLGIGADMQLGASGVMGADKDAVAWWKNYRKQAELVERHSLFGAALTPTEQASWRSADIGPNMDKDVIRTNLSTRAALAKQMLENTRQDFIDAGHSEERVNAIAGRNTRPENTGGADGSWGSKNTAKAKSVSIGGDAMEARQAPDGKYYVKQPNGKYAEVRN